MNQSGFIYPLTIMLCLFVSWLTIFHITQYSSEEQLLREQERFMQLESLLQVGIVESQKMSTIPAANENIVFSYDSGKVTLIVNESNSQMGTISLIAILTTGHQRHAWFKINWETAEIKQYVEGEIAW
ncbi:competence type IV pilus minor pilin ComGG [Bacillus suaedae]|uniref:Uncharacterized protein n=1 Tax=Halalkalibacter suaedae TaxID=2822140 RepID=A0A940X076_9BACI|nr:competence type IV pilus minor pilin ComGG [Bacillus suaedae]MBP3952341.1 hypothetical protein [Bacillus suaedae]